MPLAYLRRVDPRDLLSIDGGKYEVIRHDVNGTTSYSYYRHGQPWQARNDGALGDKFLFMLVSRLFELQDAEADGPGEDPVDKMLTESIEGEAPRLFENYSRVSGRGETVNTQFVTDWDRQLACLTQLGQRSVVGGLTLNEVSALTRRIDSEIGRMERVKDYLIGVKKSISEVMH